MNEKFYMIYVDGRNTPTKKHDTEESAIKEATRLARETGKSVYILKPIKKLEMSEIKITNLENYEK